MNQKIMLGIYFFYIITVTIEAPLRWLLDLVGLGFLLYIRDVFISLIVFYEIFLRRNLILWIFSSVLLLWALIGFYYTENIIEVLWGFKTYLPFLFGICIWKAVIDNPHKLVIFMKIVFILSCIGLGLNYFLENPFWLDIKGTDLGSGATAEGVRDWGIYYNGEVYKRLSGFTRLSNTVANIIIYSSFVLLAYTYKGKKIIYWVLGFPFICSTLIKINIAIYLYGLLLIILFFFLDEKRKLLLLKISCMLFILLGILLPVLSNTLLYISEYIDSDTMILLFASFDDRLINSWPGGFHIIWDYGNAFLGRGLGGFGFGVSLFDTKVDIVTPIDNFYLSVYGSFGLLGIGTVLYLLYKIISIKQFTAEVELLLLFAIAFFSIGIMQDMMDQISLMGLGILCGLLLHTQTLYIVNPDESGEYRTSE